LVIIFLLTSCLIDQNPKFKIVNYSDEQFDSIVLYTNHRSQTLEKVFPESSHKGRLSFDPSTKGDGMYGIDLYQKDSIVRFQSWGYFTNGASLNYSFRIELFQDSIVIKER